MLAGFQFWINCACIDPIHKLPMSILDGAVELVIGGILLEHYVVEVNEESLITTISSLPLLKAGLVTLVPNTPTFLL